MAQIGPEPHREGLYLHFPYCVVKCRYCDFNSHVEARPDTRRYLDAMLREAETRAVHSPRTVFFGGGTPSLVPQEELRRFLRELDARTGYRASAEEFTVEANPESLTAEFLEVALEGGVNRVSLGVQALDEPTLRFFGRAHDAARALAALDLVRRAGVPALNIDLIQGAPVQTRADWEAGLERILEVHPEHLSAYDLLYEPGTALGTLHEKGKLQATDDRDRAGSFLWNQRRLRAAGYRPYEVSAFAQPGFECRHNLIYWRNEPYVGLGAGAASYRGGFRSINAKEPRRYVAEMEATGRATVSSERLRPGRRAAETLMMALRLPEPLELAWLERNAGAPLEGELARAWDTLVTQRLALPPRAGKIELTRRGRRFLDLVVSRLLEASEARRG
ncbi:MAG: radical SAM family heme chaperone HemW [Planctomycetes bacterium]|nr:radical SAM family heme chaperone HemW [Planctomycetota bacterium]